MKTMYGKSNASRASICRGATCHHSFAHDTQFLEMLTIAVIGIAAAIALYAVMFIGLYHWSHYAPIFSPDDVSLAPMTGEVLDTGAAIPNLGITY